MAPVVEGAWVRTTDGAANKMMTAAFMSIVNPGDTEMKLVTATCEGAGKVELHHVVERDGKKVMEAVPEIPIPAGSHIHLTPGGLHIMLMQLQREFKLGDEVNLELKFAAGQTIKVVAPAKAASEEGEHYHPDDPQPSPTMPNTPSGPSTSVRPSTPMMPSTPPQTPGSLPPTPSSLPPKSSSTKTGRY